MDRLAVIQKMKSIRDTYLYSQINQAGAFDANIKTLLSKGIVPNDKQLEPVITTIATYYKYPLKTSVVEAYNEQVIRPMMYPPGITASHKIPTCLPFVLVPGKTTAAPDAIAIIDNYAVFEKGSDVVTVDKQKFYALMEGAFIARGLQITFNTIRQNSIMLVEATSIWAHMFTRVLNKQYALNVNRSSYQKMMYLAAKFFILNILQYPLTSANVDAYAMKAAKMENVSDITLKRLQNGFSQMKENPWENIATFIQAVAQNGHLISNGLTELTVRDFTKNFIAMYSNAALFGLEHLAYFLFNVFSSVNGAFLNNQYSFGDVIGHSGDKVYGYISTVVKGT